MLRRRLGTAALVALAVFASCREPTQITISVTTDAECPGEAGVEPTLLDTFITAGVDLKPEDLVAANVTDQCTPESGDNTIGTLVLIPGEGDSKSVEVVVIGGVDSHGDPVQGGVAALKADECRSLLETGKGVDGQPCIVARRRLGFIDHKRLSLPIKLDKRCIGVECSEDLTCFGGVCVSADVSCDDEGNCSDPSGEGGAGGAGGGTGTGGMGGGGGGSCDPLICTDECENSAKNGDCGPEGCVCSGCSGAGCNDYCATVGQGLVGSCSGDACFCVASCDQQACSAMACTGPTSGQCNPQTGVCDCVCDDTKCGDSCSSIGQTGSCQGGACVCDGTCNGPGDCAGLMCGTTAAPDCIAQSCTCVCSESLCDTQCVALGSPTGGSCGNGTCACDPACNPATCGAAPCNGTCTPQGCDCATCVPATCPSCPTQGEVPYCADPDTCGCQCVDAECTADCVAMGQAGGSCSPDCVCFGGTTTSSTGSSPSSSNASSSSTGCDFAMCNLMCGGNGLVCNGITCDCSCIQNNCDFYCGPAGGVCVAPEGPCMCNPDPTTTGMGAFGGGFMGAAGGIQ